jgi:hypothetical protein
MSYTETKIITITSDSATIQRNGSFYSHVWYDLGLFLKDEPDILHRQLTLLSAQIPYSFYVVNYTNNTLVFKVSTSPTFTTVTIPVGNYNGNSLCTVIKNLFLSAIGLTVTVALSAINGCITITCLTNQFNISSQSTCLAILGFDTNTNYTSVSGILTAPYPLNLLGIKILQVRSSTFNMLNYSSINNGITTLLGTIPVSAVPFGMIDYKDSGNTKITFTNPSLDELDIEIVDGETGQFINFNNQDWTMTFLITLTRLTEMPDKSTFNTIKGNPKEEVLTKNEPTKNELTKNEPTKDEQELNLLMS